MKQKKKTDIKNNRSAAKELLLLNEVQLLLAEKRTYLSMLRTGLAVFSVPISLIAVLVATAELHNLFQNTLLSFVVLGCLFILATAGLIIFYRAETRIKRINKMVVAIEKQSKRIDDIIIN